MQIDLCHLALVGTLLAASIVPVLAEDSRSVSFLTGNKLLELCDSQPDLAAMYVLGAIDGMNGQAALTDAPASFCMPSTVTGRQVTDMACQFVKDNPDLRHSQASVFVWTAMVSGFPCL